MPYKKWKKLMMIVFLITATGSAGCKDKGEEKITG